MNDKKWVVKNLIDKVRSRGMKIEDVVNNQESFE